MSPDRKTPVLSAAHQIEKDGLIDRVPGPDDDVEVDMTAPSPIATEGEKVKDTLMIGEQVIVLRNPTEKGGKMWHDGGWKVESSDSEKTVVTKEIDGTPYQKTIPTAELIKIKKKFEQYEKKTALDLGMEAVEEVVEAPQPANDINVESGPADELQKQIDDVNKAMIEAQARKTNAYKHQRDAESKYGVSSYEFEEANNEVEASKDEISKLMKQKVFLESQRKPATSVT